MKLSTTITGEVAIMAGNVTITLSRADAWTLLEYLHDNLRDELYQANKHTSAPSFQESLEKPWLPIQPGEEF